MITVQFKKRIGDVFVEEAEAINVSFKNGLVYVQGGVGGGHVIKSETETLPQKPNLKFVGATVENVGDDTVVSGLKGDRGDTGAQGIQGEKGDKGDKGEQGADAITTEPVTSMFTIGGIDAQEVIPQGTSLTQFVKSLITSIFNPTYVAPSSSLIASGLNTQEAGATATLTLTASFNRGSILGKIVANVWQPSTFQDYRAGAATKYTIDGVDNLLVANKTVSRVLVSGSNSFSATIDYAQGAQPTKSDGTNFETPLVAGSQTPSTSVTAYIPQWYGVDANASIDTYAECSGLTKQISSVTAFNVAFSPTAQYVYFITRNSNGAIKDGNLFNQSISSLNVEDGVSEFYKKSVSLTLLDGTSATLYVYRTRTVKTLTSFTYSIT